MAYPDPDKKLFKPPRKPDGDNPFLMLAGACSVVLVALAGFAAMVGGVLLVLALEAAPIAIGLWVIWKLTGH